ncbi:GIY-YIG nuclease family protein [Streptomyces sp. NPDC002285]
MWWQQETTDRELEAKLHQHLAAHRLSGEWFEFPQA